MNERLFGLLNVELSNVLDLHEVLVCLLGEESAAESCVVSASV